MPSPTDPDSKWFSTPKDARHRKPVNITLKPETIGKLDDLAQDAAASRSLVVESLVDKAHKKRRK